MSMITDAWVAAGSPAPNWQGKAKATRAVPHSREGVCALTGAVGEVFDARHVVSDLFTSWDAFPFRYADPAGLAFSTAAAWAFRLRIAMQRPHVLDADGFREVDPPGLFAALTVLPQNRFGFVCCPLSGQKHLLPWVEPGALVSDIGTVAWDADDVDRLGTYARLRVLGFGEAALAEPSPRWPIITRLDGPEQRIVLANWPRLDPWRRDPLYLDVAARATRTTKKENANA